ncbi:MMPL family transporter [Actinacidiphila bryophytorum]|uniref:Membrane protein ActII-3 n=1 Tax=Actinacidiphila bryophytorum TaxID=1436133 RepID=A0A9W4H3A6_9ACTN|nr:MMPL family transporter [Actinacidiphila bryophytorum]CAG7647028.1 Putative membrane protein ActII-3 [Actinacidiphila bryophytorum]
MLWLLLVAVGGSFAAKLGSVEDNSPLTWLPADAQATRAVKLAEQHFADKDHSAAVVVYVRADGLTARDLAKIDRDREQLSAQVTHGDIAGRQVSHDGRAAFLTMPLRTSPSENSVLTDAVDQVAKITEDDAPAGLDVRITGEAGSNADFFRSYSGMDAVLLGSALAVVALLLLLTYRSPVLWMVPLITVGVATQVAGGAVYLLARHAGLVVNGESVYILMILGVGVGTDYALLLVARYREELHRHHDRHTAMLVAVRRCLPTVAASAGIVSAATLCLGFGRMNSTRGLGPVLAIGIVVVFTAMTTLLPALLVVLGRWVFWPFVPRQDPGYATAAGRSSRAVWAKVAALVGRHPRVIWLATAGVLAALAVGTASVQTGQSNAEMFRKTVDSVAGQQLMAQHFPAGSASPADIYVPDTGTDAARALAVVEPLHGVASATAVATREGWTHITAVLADPPDSPAARRTVRQIRAALGDGPQRVPHAAVGGPTAVALDTADAQSSEEKLLIPLVLAVVLVLLVALLRAVVAALLLLVCAVLSYAAAVGASSLLFHALGYPRIDRGLLLFGFLFLVALGIDYTMFLMTRAREEVAQRGHREGVLAGLTVTGGVVTSAGLVLAATFTVLATLPTVAALQQGLIVAVGVLLDTFLVRSLLVPALSLEIGPRIWQPGWRAD